MAAALGWGGGTRHSHTVCHQCWCCAHTAVSHSHTAPSPPPCRARWPRGTSMPCATSIPCHAHMVTCHLRARCHRHLLAMPPWPHVTSMPRATSMLLPCAITTFWLCPHGHVSPPCPVPLSSDCPVQPPCCCCAHIATCHIHARCHRHLLAMLGGHMSHPCPVLLPCSCHAWWPCATSLLGATSIPCCAPMATCHIHTVCHLHSLPCLVASWDKGGQG